MATNLTPEQLQKIDELLFQRNKIEAIKQYRLWMGGELVDAKAFVETRLEELKRINPAAFPERKMGCAAVVMAFLGLLFGMGCWVVLWFFQVPCF